MKPPKKVFQCSNGHVICELCKNNPEVRSCPTCRVKFRGHNVVRNIVAEKLARSTFEAEDLAELSPPAPGPASGGRASTIESNPPLAVAGPGPALSFRSAMSAGDPDQFHLVGFEPAYGNYRRHTPQQEEEDEEEDDNDFLEWARIIGERSDTGEPVTNNQHRRLAEASAREEFSGEGQTRDRDTPSSRELAGGVKCFGWTLLGT